MTLGCVLAGLPATAASASSEGVITGTVTFHEQSPDRTLEVYRQSGGTWREDRTLETPIDYSGGYTVHAPAGEPVKLRVSYGEHAYGYWYGDGFGAVTAVPVQAAAGSTVSDVDLDVPAPAYVSGRLTDRSGKPAGGVVIPMVNNDGGARPLVTDPVSSSARGGYTVIVPAGYATTVLGRSQDRWYSAWLSGGGVSEPNSYLNLTPGQRVHGADIALPMQTTTVTRLRATARPVVRGHLHKRAILRASAGRWNQRTRAVRYQWLRNGHAIRHAHRRVYRVRRADVHKRISVRVTAYRGHSRAYAWSLWTHRVRRH